MSLEHYFICNDDGKVVAVDFVNRESGRTERYETYYPGSHIPFKLIGVKRNMFREIEECDGIDLLGNPNWIKK